LTFAREKDGGRRPRVESDGELDAGQGKPARRRTRSETPEIGNALRSVYQRTIDEDVPPDLLDLLGKLG
jgi:hypothetical protein